MNDVHGTINSLDYYLEMAHKGAKVISAKRTANVIDMSAANKCFDNYVKYLSSNGPSEREVQRLFDMYMESKEEN